MQQTIASKGTRLSQQQMRLWSLQQQEDASLYSTRGVMSLDGELDMGSLHQALLRLCQRHEILRTMFYQVPGMQMPLQVVTDIALTYPEIDLQALNAAEQHAQLERLASQSAQFDLAHAPVWHLWLLRLAPTHHMLFFCFPALSADASTLSLLMTELSQLYADCCGEAGDLVSEEDLLQYAEVAAWQNELLHEDDAQEALAYWRTFDLTHLSETRLPFEHTVAEARSNSAFSVYECSLDQRHLSVLEALCESASITPAAVLLSCWQLALARLLSETKFLVGVLCDGRPYEELSGAPGLLSGMVPVRADLEQDYSMRQLFQKVHSALKKASEEQLYFIWNGEQSELFFPLSFTYLNWPQPSLAGNVRFSLQSADSHVERFCLQLSALNMGKSLRLQLPYSRGVFVYDEVQRIGEIFHSLLRSALAQPEAPMSTLSLVSQEEEQRLLRLGIGPQLRVPELPLQRLFEAHVERAPQQTALICGSERLSYQQVNSQANRLAHWMRGQGIGPNAFVALCMERSSAMIIALLAVLKSGGTYVPLDPDNPPARLSYQLAELQPGIVLTQVALRNRLPSDHASVVLCVEEWDRELASASEENLPAGDLDQVAYIMYTSGSTGAPKGVMITQRSLVNYVQALEERLEIEAGWHFGTVSTLAADLGNTAIFGALATGGTLHVLPYGVITNGASFAQAMRKTPLDLLKIVPSHLEALLVGGGPEIFPRRALVLGGEALSWALVQRIQASGAQCEIVNHYGPTESTIGVFVRRHVAYDGGCEAQGTVGLGSPLANIEAYVLDERLQVVPEEVAGELYLGGLGLAYGYLHQEALTRERFIAHPWRSGALLYRTGDRVRWSASGDLQFIGRVDSQMKIRGYRVEPGEIEEVLKRHPTMQHCVVVPREDIQGEKRLIAYAVITLDQELSTAGMRAFLVEHLPGYMIPEALVCLNALPLTSNGKINYRALPAPAQEVETKERVAAPRGALEEMLLDIWRDVLPEKEIGIFDDFFKLGGHSLMATRVVARICKVFSIDLPILSLFEASTIAELAVRVEELLYAGQRSTLPPMLHIAREDEIPLSFAQQRLWFLDQLEPESSAYTIPLAAHMVGDLEREALRMSFQELVERHESLRTTFVRGADQSVTQLISPADVFPLPVIDLSALRAEERVPEAQRLVQQEARAPFDLSRGPLLRAALLELEPGQHVFLATMHHIVSDGWSSGIMMRELATLYEAFKSGKSAELPELPIRYADYAIWQRQWLQGAVLDEQVRYWKEQLTGIVPLELPTDHTRPAMQSYRGSQRTLTLPGPLLAQLKDLSRGEGVTLFMTLLAAFQVLLARYSGQQDIAVGSPIANRARHETENVIGFFVNTLVLRADVSGNPTFNTFLQRVRDVCLGAYAHQDVPFEHLVEVLQPRRELSRSPLFQVLFTMQNAFEGVPTLDRLELSPFALEHSTAKFDLELVMGETEQGLSCQIEYNSDLFEESTIVSLLQSWQTLLNSIVARPTSILAELELVPAEDKALLLHTWNATQVDGDERQSHSFVELFARQVAANSDAIAIATDAEQVSYSELDRRSTQLASHLAQAGVGQETLVGLYLARSTESLIALLAVFKAGGVYVPLDPASPAERLRTILEQGRLSLVLTTPTLRPTAPAGIERLLVLDPSWQTYQHEPQTVPHVAYHGSQLAYSIFTSGSTGLPKGAMVTQQGMLNHLLAKVDDLDLTSGDRVAQTAALHFDISVWQFLSALLVGGQVQVLVDDIAHDPHRLLPALEREGITVLEVVPSVLRALLDDAPATPAAIALRWLVVTGEAFPAELGARWQQGYPSVPLVNAYGPTECSDDVTHEFVSPQTAQRTGILPLGRAIANTQLYVLDKNLSLLPIGVPGELWVGGMGVGRGYLRRVELTAEVFAPDLFGDRPGERLYHTGDLVRYRADGRLDYLGRIDHQVKVRGYRIELGEIEAHLQRHPAIQASVVVAREDSTADRTLVAYLVATSEEHPAPAELRAWLERTLPSYMLPAYFVFLPALPLTPNGKVDRNALPAPSVEESGAPDSGHTPRGAVEQLLANLWTRVLGVSVEDRDAQFFDLGGHSLLATQIMARVQEVFGVELPLRVLFEAATVAELAARIEDALRMGLRSPMPPLVPAPRQSAYPLSFAQQRLWFLDQLEPNTASYNIPMVVRIEGPLNVVALQETVRELARRHESLRTVFVAHDGQPVQVIRPVEEFELQVVSVWENEEQAYQQEAQRPFDLAHGPLMRATLFLSNPQHAVLLLSVHHIVSDGWSSDVLVGELIALYQAFAEGKPSPLPELPVQYTDFTLWQRQWLSGEVLDEQVRYWRHQLEDVEPLELPTDYPRPVVQGSRGARYHFAFPQELSAQLRVFSQREGVTLFMLMLSAFQALLARYSGQDDIAVGTLIANRRHVETEKLVGYFVNTLVLRTDLTDNPTVRDLLARVRNIALRAYSHQDVPFERLLDVLQPDRDLSRTPLFQVVLQLRTVADDALTLPGLRLEPLSVESTSSKFDLFMDLLEMGEHLQGQIEYRTELFSEQTIARLQAHFQAFLTGFLSDPLQRIGDIALATSGEQQVIRAWNMTQADYPRERGLHELFADQVARTPAASALVAGELCLSYAELDQRANQLAHYLRKLAVGPGVPVGIYLERSPELIVSVLAMLKAGGVYVPLDIAAPVERVAWTIEDAYLPVLLTTTALSARLAPGISHTVCVDSVWPVIAQESVDAPVSRTVALSPAYIIYTSGSTGQPKGVVVPHQAVVNYVSAFQRQYEPGLHDRVLQFASICFDTAAEEIFPALCSGAALVLRTENHAPSLQEFLTLVRDERITILDLPTAYWHEWAANLSDNLVDALPDLRLVIIGGEKALPERLALWYPLAGHGPQLVNTYGPTETTIVATACELTPQRVEAANVSIGSPIANVQVYVLDAHQQPFPPGMPGELYIGGAGLAQGYLDRPELTAERFVPDPFSSVPGMRLYCSGDRVRLQPDGTLEFLKRIDQQVKLRGYRIELEEIEAVLRQHEAVQDCVVLLREDIPGRKQLVAYVVPHAGVEVPSSASMYAYMQRLLPDYMLPAAFVVLPALPLTTSGKINRRVLPAVESGTVSADTAFVAPQTRTQSLLARTWQQVLGVEEVSIHDNFFALGGDSILSIAIIARAAHDGLSLTPRQFFQHQTIAGLADLLDAEGGERQSPDVSLQPLLELTTYRVMLANEPDAEHIIDAYPLSPLQQGMLFHTLYEPASGVYIGQISCRLRGPMDLAMLRAAWQEVVKRHSILRTTFLWEQLDEPLQLVLDEVELPWEERDWRALGTQEQAQSLARFLREERERGFALRSAPLMRIAMLRLADDAYQFIWTHHQLLLDGWSLAQVLKEVFALYEARRQAQSVELAQPRPYREYIAWLRQQDLAAVEGFWRARLEGITAPTPLPEDRQLAGHGEEIGAAVESLEFSPALTAALQEAAREQHLTLNTFIQGAWALLLSRYSNELDVVYGATVAGRPPLLSGVEAMVGLFINTLPMRVHVSPRQSVRDWLREVQVQLADQRQYEYTPLVQIQGWSAVPRGLPLFESVVVFENYPVDTAVRAGLPGIEFEETHFFEQTNYALTLVAELGETLYLRLGFQCKRFTGAAVRRLLGHFQTLLEGMVRNVDLPLADLEMLTAAERRQMLVAWNDTREAVAAPDTVQSLFAVQVAATPDALAVSCDDVQLSYACLQEQAHKIAQLLRARGVGPEVPVAVLAERGIPFVVAMLGVFLAGGVYLPLDPLHPSERLLHVLRQSKSRLVLTTRAFQDRIEHVQSLLTDEEPLAVVLLEDALAGSPVAAFEPMIHSHTRHLMYIIYTSGSTGLPKGVMVEQAGMLNHIRAKLRDTHFQPGDTIAQNGPQCFDISVWQAIAALLYGGQVHVIPDEQAMDAARLLAEIEEQKVAVLQLVPVLLRALITELEERGGSRPQLSALRWIVPTGEALPPELCRRWLALYPAIPLLNTYGSTECSDDQCHYPIVRYTDELHTYSVAPIGRPIANMQAYVLNDALQPVPVGVEGELYIGGLGVGRGYLDEAERTALAFIPHPLSQESGTRLYKTGDRARYAPDGSLEFLGRNDQRVKVRGHRVEPGEIEAVFSQHGEIHASVVLASEDGPEKTWLNAYIVPRAGSTFSSEGLRTFLRERLPDYMVPANFVLLEALPLTPNGKIDRQALLNLAVESAEADEDQEVPHAGVEAAVAALWEQVLRHPVTDRHEEFFAVGGHSLLATQIMTRIDEAFGVQLPLRTLFEFPTVAGLAGQIESALHTSRGLHVPPLQPMERGDELPLSFSQQRLWFLDQWEPGSASYNIPLIIRIDGRLHVDAIEAGLTEITRRHEGLRTVIAQRDGRPLQIIKPASEFVLPYVDLSAMTIAEREREAKRLAQAETERSFDLAHGPLMRVSLVSLDPSTHLLFLNMHHIISDGWSMGIVAQELSTFYTASVTGAPVTLPVLPVQYVDYVLWQRQWLVGDALESHLAYWRQQMAGAPELLELPTDYPRPQVQTFAGASQEFTFPRELLERLHRLSQKEGVTLFMTLLAAFQLLLARYSGQDDIVVGTPIANRSRPELEVLIGFFANTLVLRTDLAGDPTLHQLLMRVREVCLGAYAHQDMPFEHLLELLHVRRDTSHMPLFQVLFALENMEVSSLEVPGIVSRQEFVDRGTSRFDLAISLHESPRGLQGLVEYSTALFTPATIERMLTHFQLLLEQMVAADSERHVAQFSLLTPEEHQRIIYAWNRSEAGYARDMCFHQLFEAQASLLPDAVALVLEDIQLTYRELNERANQLAHYLQAHHAVPEMRVGLLLERSSDVMVAILGTLKAGAAYVPLDPSYPVERLDFIMADSQMSLLVTDQDVVGDRLASGVQHVHLLHQAEELARQRKTNPGSAVTSDNLAYIIYTSGSIGQPKGVMVAHRGLNNVAAMEKRMFAAGPGSRVLQLASFSFDASLWDVCVALTTGGTLYLATNDARLPGTALTKVLQEQAITMATLTPSVLAALPADNLPDLRIIVSTGEAVTAAVIARWAMEHRFFNGYGPTEVTIGATIGECFLAAGDPHIGYPFSNAQIYVLDAAGQPVPVGVPGEVYVGGIGLARGYVLRPDLTAERFVPDPFSLSPGERLYRTGDVARWLPDGRLAFVGRVDYQVKLRGFRIELGEIEVILTRHLAIREAAVILREDVPGEKRLVAYLVPRTGESVPTVAEIRSSIQEYLPAYMVPAAFVILDELPLTSHGKVDRRALPQPDPEQDERQQESYREPRTEIERQLATIWQRVLGRPRVGVEENFFALGGDSILSIQIIARAGQLGLYLTPKQLFQAQTIAALGQLVSQQPTQAAQQAEQGVLLGDLEMTPIQHWFWQQYLSEPWHYNQAVLLQVRERLQVELLEQAVRAVLAQHDALRLRVWQAPGSGWQQAYSDLPAVGESLVEQVRLDGLAESKRAAALEAHTQRVQRGLDLGSGRLLRVMQVEWGAGDPQRLVLLGHHLAVDGVSWRIILGDLQVAYTQAREGADRELGPKTSSYRQWSAGLAAWVRSAELQEQASYWRERLARVQAWEENEIAGRWEEQETVEASLDAQETRALLEEVPQAYQTRINEVLVTGLSRSVAAWRGVGTVRLDMEGHGREGLEEQGLDVSRTVGWFTSIYPIVVEVTGDELIGRDLKGVKEQMRAIPHHGLGYGVLRYLAGAEDLQTSAPIIFNYLGQVDQELDEKGWWRPAQESTGSLYSLQAPRPYAWEISAIVVDNRLQVSWSYNGQVHDRENIAALLDQFLRELRAIIAHCRLPEAGSYTPSDFPLAGLGQLELDRVAGSRKNIADIYPLSPLQQGMLFHSLYAPGSGVYIEQVTSRLQGRLNMVAFHEAWNVVIRRHVILRTAFVWEALERPLQIVYEQVECPWEEHDWRAKKPREQVEDFAQFLHEDRRRGFDLGLAPLMRFSLFHLAEGIYNLVWSSHHIIFDGWSLAQVLKEVFAFYEQRIGQAAVTLPEPRPYRDYILWLQQQDLSDSERYWRQYLRGISTPTPLNIAAAQDVGSSVGNYATGSLALTEQTTAALRELARAHQLTFSTLVQGAWALLLSMYSGEHDVVFGATVAGRPASFTDIDSMVGLFINTLPVRVQIEPQRRVDLWLRQLQEQLVEQRQYEYTPLVQIQGWSAVPRSQSLFESIVVFENYPVDASVLVGLRDVELEQVRFIEQTNYPLSLVARLDKVLELTIDYAGERFAASAIQRLLAHLGALLTSIAGSSMQPLAQLTPLTEAERGLLLHGWNDTACDYPRPATLHQLFEQQALLTPDSIALAWNEMQFSYAQLNASANRLALYLRQQGVGSDTSVGLYMERTPMMVIGMLAVLKAGGAYLPLDPTYPPERLRFMLQDAAPLLVLTLEKLSHRLDAVSVRLLYLDDEQAPVAGGAGARNPEYSADPEQLAYIMYTSGSTGNPKGVCMPHRPLVNLFHWQIEGLHLKPGARTLQSASISFDISCNELFTTWLSGGTTVLLPASHTGDFEEMYQVICEQAIQWLFTPFTLLQQIAEYARQAAIWPEALEAIMCTAEPLQITGGLRTFFERLPGCHLHNEYGPTETHVVSSLSLQGPVAQWPALPTIGRPIGNTSLYVLDEYLQLVPPGLTGELYIGGVNVARGYWQRPGQTAERFVPDPFSAVPGMRLYRTGDIVRWHEDGTLEYLGRNDAQVKLRGYRIEPGEIETVLLRFSGIRTCVVQVREDTPGDKRLVAYVVLQEGASVPTLSALREHLKERLPDYMLPGAFVFLETLPITPSGKVDRRALPVPDAAHPELEETYVAPRTVTQQLLTGIWQQVLEIEKPGIADDFFALGGHSLLATQVHARLRATFGVELPLRSLFEAPTIAALAELIEASQRANEGLKLEELPLVPVASTELALLSFAQQRLWFLDQLEPDSPLYNLATAVRFQGHLLVEALRVSLQQVVRRHEILRTVFESVQGEGRQRTVEPGLFSLPVIDLSALEETERAEVAHALIVQEAHRPFDLVRGPLLRASLLRQSAQEHILLVTMHHIVTDGWSIEILVREASTLYTARVRGEVVALSPLPVQYSDYARWQRARLHDAVLEQELSYWREHLAGAPELLPLPLDYARPATLSYQGNTLAFTVPTEIVHELRLVSQRENVTFFMLLMGAFQLLLAHASGQSDIVVGTPIANRQRPELEPLIGFFVNTLLMRTDVASDLTVRDLLRRVREVCLSAYSHQDAPFERIIQELQPRRADNYIPFLQVWFVLEDIPSGEIALPDLTLLPQEGANPLARYDLRLNLYEGAAGLQGILEYQTDLFAAATIEGMSQNLLLLLEQLAKAAPETPLSALTRLLAREEERRRHLAEEKIAAYSARALKRVSRKNIVPGKQ